jgi:dihydropteroate synthase
MSPPQTGAPLILMHSIGTPETMQELAATGAYDDVLLDVYDGLEAAVAQAEAAGVAVRAHRRRSRHRLWQDDSIRTAP